MDDTKKLTRSLGAYLKRISDSYKNKDKNSFQSILSSFSEMSKDYSEFANKDKELNKYSNIDFSKCTHEEQKQFYEEQLQFIECLVMNKIYDMGGSIYNWYNIYSLMINPSYANVEKSNRKVIYSCTNTNRPIGESSYLTWNGFQIIDLDIKNAELCDNLKPLIFNDLSVFNWFLGVYKSASGNGLHVWTKIHPISLDLSAKRTEYLCNFRHKYSYVYVTLLKYESRFNYTKDDVFRFMDMAMAKPQQGSFISYDPGALLSTNFIDLRLDVNFETAIDNGIETIDWISHPDLKEIFKKLDWFSNESFDVKSNINVSDLKIEDRDVKKSLGKRHYKHTQRWQLANTLVALYGEDKALNIILEITSGTSYRELAGDIKTASIHNKPISLWAVNELNKNHGFNIKIDNTNVYKSELDRIEQKMQDDGSCYDDPTKILNEETTTTKLYLRHDQYLSDIKDDIIKNLSHITLLEAGAGYGKTEMIKAFKSKTLLILPFTSTIKAKVESSETTKDWMYFYGNKRPTLDNIFENRSMTMTIDKFSRLNLMELNQANFEYIVIDESHLLFTSSYRGVMAPTIQRLANCSAKVIMMSGTPTGEMLFFPKIKHIKVIKEDYREKKFTVHYSPHKIEQFYNMCKCMADDVIAGRKVLFPTNKGNLNYETVSGFIQFILNNTPGVSHKLRSFYYKKSNYGDENMDNINISKTYGDNDIVFCTNYLSVGVDICDEHTFSVYFDEMMIPQDIEQFANRLRNNDLYLHLFLPLNTDEGLPINYHYVKPLDLSFDETELLFLRDLLKTTNDMLERNNEEAKYSPIITSILSSHKALMYDENECKYYIDATTYKLNVFEERYEEYSKQLEVMLSGLRYYGYNVDIINHENLLSEKGKNYIESYKKACRNAKYNENTTKTFELLDHINDGNIDIYKDFMGGSYDIFRSPEFSEVRIEHKLFVKDIEIITKNMPIILSLYKFYTIDVIKDIYKYCVNIKSNSINYSQLTRIRKFVKIESNRRKKRLDFPVLKFLSEAKDYALKNPIVKTTDRDMWIATFASKYANSIKDVVLEDFTYHEYIYELSKELWKIVIIESNASKGKVKIKPFELLWEERTHLEDIYNNSIENTFFLQELLDKMDDGSSDGSYFDESETEMDLPHTSKKHLEDIKEEIPNVVVDGFDYEDYSNKDKSNERFIRKQENTNSLVDSIFNSNALQEEEDVEEDETKELTIFD